MGIVGNLWEGIKVIFCLVILCPAMSSPNLVLEMERKIKKKRCQIRSGWVSDPGSSQLAAMSANHFTIPHAWSKLLKCARFSGIFLSFCPSFTRIIKLKSNVCSDK